MKSERELKDFVSNNSENANSLCRLCLTHSIQNLISLFEIHNTTTLSQKIMLCTRLRIALNDGLPSNLCTECLQELEIADNFRVKCEFSDLLLRKVYKVENDLQANNLENHFCSVEPLKEEGFIEVDSIKEEPIDASSPLNYVSDHEIDFNKSRNKLRKRKEKKRLNKNIIETKLGIEVDTEIKEEIEKNIASEKIELKNVSLDHDEPEKWICSQCGKPLKSKYSLVKHIESMHNAEKLQKYGKVTGYGKERMFHCSECDYKCPRRQRLLYHMTTHTGDRPFECDLCNRRFSQHSGLNNHKKTHSDKMNYTCQECGKQFKIKDAYMRHKRVHSDVRPHVCSICSKGLKSLNSLKDHMNRHNNIKNYRCEKCGMAVVSRAELTNHLRNHGLGGDKLKCNICEYSTYLKKSLILHIRRHAGDRSFKCELCEFSCYTKDELRFHMRKHTKEQNYSCPICEMKFRHSPSVNKHMFKVHGRKYKWNDCVDRRFIK